MSTTTARDLRHVGSLAPKCSSVVEGDKRLFNQCGVTLVNPAKHPAVKKEPGQTFVDWLISPDGQAAFAGYKIDGQQLFFPNAAKGAG